MYYDRTDRRDPTLTEDRNTEDVDFQDRFSLPGRQDVVWGLGYRITADQTSATGLTFFNPADQTLQTYSSFLQDTLAIIPDRFSFILGTKLEHNDYSGLELQPSVRLLGTPTDHQTLWVSVSRAVRTPSRIDRDIGGEITGDGVGSEKVIAYELGYRTQPWSRLSVDVAGFYNDYNDLETLETTIPPTTLPIPFANKMKGYSEGFETALDVQVLPWWRLRGTYSLTDLNFRSKAGSVDTFSEQLSEGETLRHTVTLHSLFNLPHHTELDPILRYASDLSGDPAIGTPGTPHYMEMDVRGAWHVTRQLELALVGQNLLHAHHPEYGSTVEIQRGVYGKVTWQWGS
jgi:iron complex outermembrane receptor protein